MRWLVFYFRSLFCDHVWDYSQMDMTSFLRDGPMVSATCDKCGWHRSYWKY